MQATQHPNIRLRDPGELIAAVPHILGYRPAESVVICVHAGKNGKQITVCARTDLPPPNHHWDVAEQLKHLMTRAKAKAVSVIIVGEAEETPPPLPHLTFVQAIATVFTSAGLTINHAMWTSTIRHGADWHCYDDVGCKGLLPDPNGTELAAAAAVDGMITYESRADLRRSLEPATPRVLKRRERRIREALDQRPDEGHAVKLVEDVFADLAEGRFTLDDDRVVDLAVALSHRKARDACLRPDRLTQGSKAQQMWTDLTREMPSPYRAEPACLLALCAFVRGNGVVAGIALEIAQEAVPDHVVAGLVRTVMDVGMTPKDLIKGLAAAAAKETHDS
ncbi:DUF4192 domain-containing protein [Actinocrispum wychmicini]|uniref:Uncharacterized protein DUF4192 n=1 Tax=Actinocrispum wychmicini TaxID=1213861 RepID=A0A4R2J2N3_9PSEU|nr:DUF4192 domain-containing protein [Actinocrispum wychmicini]TCO52563.1 uncharacterized protein DUF4192 [Actinocrispum wychmicini]